MQADMVVTVANCDGRSKACLRERGRFGTDYGRVLLKISSLEFSSSKDLMSSTTTLTSLAAADTFASKLRPMLVIVISSLM